VFSAPCFVVIVTPWAARDRWDRDLGEHVAGDVVAASSLLSQHAGEADATHPVVPDRNSVVIVNNATISTMTAVDGATP